MSYFGSWWEKMKMSTGWQNDGYSDNTTDIGNSRTVIGTGTVTRIETGTGTGLGISPYPQPLFPNVPSEWEAIQSKPIPVLDDLGPTPLCQRTAKQKLRDKLQNNKTCSGPDQRKDEAIQDTLLRHRIVCRQCKRYVGNEGYCP